MALYRLPIDRDIGLPQQVRFRISGVAYVAYLRQVPALIDDPITQEEMYLPWIRYIYTFRDAYSDEAYVTVQIVRISDGATVLLTRLCRLTPVVARDPDTHQVLMTLFALSATEVWVGT